MAREHRPKMIVTGATAYPRFWDFAAFRAIADEVGAYLMTDMAHFAGLVAADVHPSPCRTPHVVTTTTHKTLRGPRGGMILCHEDLAKAIDKAVFPGTPGRAAEHVIAAKAVAFRAGDERRVPRATQSRRWQRPVAGCRAGRGRRRDHHRRDRQPPDAGRRSAAGRDRQGGRSALGEVRITVNRNTIPYDPNPPMVGSAASGSERPRSPAVACSEAEMATIAQLIVDGIAARGDEAAQAAIRDRVATITDRFPVPGLPGRSSPAIDVPA